MFWDPKIEKLSREKLEKLQLERLKKTLQYVFSRSPFYKKRFTEKKFRPSMVKSLDGLARVPFTYIDDLRKNYPYGLLAVDKSETVRLHTSSGTTGKPKAIFFTRDDIGRGADLIARCLVMTGVTKKDVLQNMMSYGLFTGGLVMHYGAEKVGALVIPAGIGNTDRQLMLMQDFGTTSIHITPSYALYIADVFEKKGLDPRKELKLKRAYMGAEPHSEETRRKIESAFGIDVYNSYGLSEMNGPGVAFECQYKDGMHLWEDHFIMEIIDPVTGRQLPPGQEGELVLTTLCRVGMPILRYRTKDITRIITAPCRCGRTHRRIARITGRSDDMFIIKGVNIFPQQIERVLMGIKGVARNYLIQLESYDELIVKVEIQKRSFDGSVDHMAGLKAEIEGKLRAELLVRPKIELHEPGSLPVSEGKAKRVIDNRKL
ncbi:MAG: phenylacetate--CoA ligase [Elusimicrobia bacterium RIFOXYB2_FULL_48_7]|nr:MAG: phenylacetate--CoA ligase [Elusimicrobia bacterium RIFOXYB2_FULL_48_7]